MKVGATPAKNHSKQPFCSEKDLYPDSELPPVSEEPRRFSSSKAIETEADDSLCCTPELFDPVDTDEEKTEVDEIDRSSNNSAEDLFETITGFSQKWKLKVAETQSWVESFWWKEQNQQLVYAS